MLVIKIANQYPARQAVRCKIACGKRRALATSNPTRSPTAVLNRRSALAFIQPVERMEITTVYTATASRNIASQPSLGVRLRRDCAARAAAFTGGYWWIGGRAGGLGTGI